LDALVQSFSGLRGVDVLDIIFVSGLSWVAIAWVREARARVALGGVAAIALLFWTAEWLDLRLMTSLLRGFFAVAALVLVVVFQDDLRRFFEGITLWFVRNATPRPSSDVLDDLGSLCFSLARRNVGSLFVFPGREPLDRLLDGGQYLDGRVSEPLLRSLLDPGTPGHDGAIVIRGGQVTRFGVHLPLSTEWSEIGAGGTRHAAALGLAERSDAFSIVVSEERGEVSVAWRGRLTKVEEPASLRTLVEKFLTRTAKRRRENWIESRLTLARRHWREGVVATAMATGLWVSSVPGVTLDRSSKAIPVVIENLPEGYRVSAIEPAAVDVEFEGTRRDLAFAAAKEFQVRVDGDLVDQGRRTFSVDADQVEHPPELRVVDMKPVKVRLSIDSL
jgi:diadenylate cyclase